MDNTTKKLIDFDYIIECDVLIALVNSNGDENIFNLIKSNLKTEYFKNKQCRYIFEKLIENVDPLSILEKAKDDDDINVSKTLSEILKKKVSKENIYKLCSNLIERILNRRWVTQRETVRNLINSDIFDEEDLSVFLTLFNKLLRNPPKIKDMNLLKKE